MTLTWLVGAAGIALASFVMGLAGFGIGLVALAFLPYVMPPATAVVLLTIYAFVFSLAMFIPLRGDATIPSLVDLLIGTVVAMPPGVWALAALPASVLTRLIGFMLLVAVALSWWGRYPDRLDGRGWGLGAGALAGLLGGAVGLPGPPVVLYAAARGWAPRTMKANIQAFFIVNEGVILLGYWWAGLLTLDVLRLAVSFGVPAVAGVLVGVSLFNRIDAVKFRRVVFGLLFVSGLTMIVRG